MYAARTYRHDGECCVAWFGDVAQAEDVVVYGVESLAELEAFGRDEVGW